MSGPYQKLIERIRGEITDLEQVIERALRGWSAVQAKSAEQYAYLDSVALNLHSFYQLNQSPGTLGQNIGALLRAVNEKQKFIQHIPAQ